MKLTFLQMCQKVADGVGLHGQLSSVSPSQPIHIDIVDAVKDSWIYIQQMKSMSRFMQGTKAFTTTAGISTYKRSAVDPGGVMGRIESVVYNKGTLPRAEIEQIPYLTDDTAGAPKWWYEDSVVTRFSLDNNIVFNKLDKGYDVFFLYRKMPQVLEDPGDYPTLPEELHYAIVHKALAHMGLKTHRQEIAEVHNMQFDNLMTGFFQSQIPKKRMKQKRFI